MPHLTPAPAPGRPARHGRKLVLAAVGLAVAVAVTVGCGITGTDQQEEDPDDAGSSTAAPTFSAGNEGAGDLEFTPGASASGQSENGPEIPAQDEWTISIGLEPGRASSALFFPSQDGQSDLKIKLVKEPGQPVLLSLIAPTGLKVLSNQWPAQSTEHEISWSWARGGRHLLSLTSPGQVRVSVRTNAQVQPGNPPLTGSVPGGSVRILAADTVAPAGAKPEEINCSVSWDAEAGSRGFLQVLGLSPTRSEILPGQHFGKASILIKGSDAKAGTWLLAVVAPPGDSQQFSAQCANQAIYLMEHQASQIISPSGYQPARVVLKTRRSQELVVLALKEPSLGDVNVSLVNAGGSVVDQRAQWEASSSAVILRSVPGQRGEYQLVLLSRVAQGFDAYMVEVDNPS